MEKAPNSRIPPKVTLRRLLGLARPEVRTLIAGSFFLAIGSGMGLLYPQAMRLIIDEALGARNRALIDRAALGMTVILAIQSVAIALRFYLFTTAGERVVTRLRQNLFASLMSQEVAFFDERKTGELTNRLASDTTVLQNTVSANISMVLRNGAQALGGIGMLFYTSPRLTPADAGRGAAGGGGRGDLRAAGAQALQGGAGRAGIARTRWPRRACPASAPCAPSRRRRARWIATATRWRRPSSSRAAAIRQSATFLGVASFGGFAAAAVVLWYGGRLVVDGVLTVGGLTSFLVYSMFVAFSLGALTELWADFMRAAGAAERVFELLDREPAIPASGGERLSTRRGPRAVRRRCASPTPRVRTCRCSRAST